MGMPVLMPGPTTSGATPKLRVQASTKIRLSCGTTDAMIDPSISATAIRRRSMSDKMSSPISSLVADRFVAIRKWWASVGGVVAPVR